MVTYSNQDVHQQEQRINQEEYVFVDICKDTGFNIQNCYFAAAHVDEHWGFSMFKLEVCCRQVFFAMKLIGWWKLHIAALKPRPRHMEMGGLVQVRIVAQLFEAPILHWYYGYIMGIHGL